MVEDDGGGGEAEEDDGGGEGGDEGGAGAGQEEKKEDPGEEGEERERGEGGGGGGGGGDACKRWEVGARALVMCQWEGEGQKGVEEAVVVCEEAGVQAAQQSSVRMSRMLQYLAGGLMIQRTSAA